LGVRDRGYGRGHRHNLAGGGVGLWGRQSAR
jgi:hypothetical protein